MSYNLHSTNTRKFFHVHVVFQHDPAHSSQLIIVFLQQARFGSLIAAVISWTSSMSNREAEALRSEQAQQNDSSVQQHTRRRAVPTQAGQPDRFMFSRLTSYFVRLKDDAWVMFAACQPRAVHPWGATSHVTPPRST